MKLLSALDHSSRLHRPTPAVGLDGTDLADPAELADVAARIERHGLSDIEPSVLIAIAGRARRVGVHPEVAELLTDAEAPTVVRVRAFGLIHRRLSAAQPVGTDPELAAA